MSNYNPDDYQQIIAVEDVTEEILQAVREIESGWYSEGRIDWEDVWERLERQTLNNGKKIDLGPEIGSPAMLKIRRVINKERREG